MRKSFNQKVTQIGVTFLTICLIVAMLPISAFAEDITTSLESLDIVYSEDDIKTASNGDLYFLSSEEKNTFQLEVKAQPSDASADVTWRMIQGATNVTIDENGLVTVTKDYMGQSICKFLATSKENSKISKIITINILSPIYLSLDDDALNITLPENGQSSRERFKVLPAKLDTYGLLDYSVEKNDFFETEFDKNACYITPKKPGTAKITFKNTANNDTVVATVSITGVAVNSEDGKTSGMLTKGKQMKLTAIGESEDETFTWESSDEEVATVDQNGNVTGVKLGRAYIYATSSNGNKGGYKVNVKETDNMPYLEGLELDNYSKFNDWSSSTSNFEPSILNYDLNVKTASTGILTANLKLTYDEEKYKVVVYKNGEVSTEVKNSGELTTTALDPGETKIVVRVSSLEDENVYTDYTFNATRPRNTNYNLRRMDIYPTGRDLIKSPTYRGYAEASMFKIDSETGNLTYASTSTSGQKYRIFLYNDTKSFKLSPFLDDLGTKAKITIDDNEPFMLDRTTNETDTISFGDKDTVSVKVETCSDLTYYTNEQSGKEDPFEVEGTYYFEIQRIDLDLDGAKILKAEKSQGTWCTPVFNKDISAGTILLPYGERSVDLTLTVEEGTKIYKTSVSEANLITPSEDGTCKVTLTLPEGKQKYATNFYVVRTLDDGAELKSKYTFTICSPYEFAADKDRVPSKVVDFISPGSQYTNKIGGYSMFPETSLICGGLWSTPVSVGNFGGYITYYYDKAIQNNPNNPYGIDFTVFGNSNGGQSFSEPGNVLVSKDGETWYTLAGSAHYDDNAIWDYELTYNQDGTYKDNQGDSGTLESMYGYPKAEYFPLFKGWGEDKTSLTFKGTLLLNASGSKDPYGSSQAAYPDFGYADTHRNTTTVGSNGNSVDLMDYKVGNPYTGQYDECGDGFDLDWAVDEDGYPVKLDEIHYIKVQTASFICAGSIGEKSTEVNAIGRTEAGETAVGKTSAPTSIIVGDKTIELKEGVSTYNVEFPQNFEVKVNTNEDANVYINGQKGATRTFTSLPSKGIVRVIVQEGEKEPVIYYLTNKQVETVNVTFDADNGEEVITKSVESGGSLDYTPSIPTKEGYTFVGWYKDTDDTTTEYKSDVTYDQDITYKAKWAHVEMLGAQVKLVVDDKSGIRFGTKLYNDGDEIVEKGTLIIPASLLAEGETLTLNTPKVAKSIGKVNYEVNKEENYVTYLGTIVNIPKAQFDRQMIAAAYVIYKDKAGNKYTVYSQYPNGSTSVYKLLENNVDWDDEW